MAGRAGRQVLEHPSPLTRSKGLFPMPKAEQNATTSHGVRRDLLAGFASMLLLVPSEAGANKAAELDGELIAACAEFGRLEAAYDVACRAEDRAPDGPAKDALLDQLDVLGDEQLAVYAAICAAPARTPEGLRAKAQALACWFAKAGDGVPCNREDQLAWSLVRDVLGWV